MDTIERITALAASEFGGDPATMDPDAPVETLGADSLGFLEFLFRLEDDFGVAIPQDEAVKIRTLRALAAFIDGLVEAQGAQPGVAPKS